MNRPHDVLTVNFETITPLFLGGAEPEKKAEIRVPSFKAALRYWYRAIDPEFANYEPLLFGSDKLGQSSIIIKAVSNYIESLDRWNRNDAGIYKPNEPIYHPDMPKSLKTEREKNTYGLDGVNYFSFPFSMTGGGRAYIPTGTNITFKLLFKPNTGNDIKKRILASLWLFAQLGGLGARSRRAFGSLNAKFSDAKDPAIFGENALPDLAELASPEEWIKRLQEGYSTMSKWLHCKKCTPDHAVLHGGRVCIFSQGYDDWSEALFNAGRVMQEFRQRRNPDHDDVREHIIATDNHYRKYSGDTSSGRRINRLPERTGFGLPLTFRYNSLTYTIKENNGSERLNKQRKPIRKQRKPIRRTPNVEFNRRDSSKKQAGRSASRLHVRIVKIGNKFHPVYIQLNAPLLPPDTAVTEIKGNQFSPHKRYDHILDEFWKSLPSRHEFSFG